MVSSTSDAIWSNLFYLYLSIALVVGTLVMGWLFYNMVKFRAKPGAPRPPDAPVAGMVTAERGHVLWSWGTAATIALIMFGLAFSTIDAVATLETAPTDEPTVHHNVTGFQFGWKFNYTGPGEVPFQKIGDFYVPEDTPVVLNVTSQDVWHNFAIPNFRVRIDAIPGETTHIWFRAGEPGDVNLACVQICGSSHALMKAKIHVLPTADYPTWLTEETNKEAAKMGTAFQRDAKRGTLVNVTLDASGAPSAQQSDLAASKAALFNVTNEGASPVTVSVGGASVPVPAGGYAYLYTTAPSTGTVTLRTSGGQSADFQVVS